MNDREACSEAHEITSRQALPVPRGMYAATLEFPGRWDGTKTQKIPCQKFAATLFLAAVLKSWDGPGC